MESKDKTDQSSEHSEQNETTQQQKGTSDKKMPFDVTYCPRKICK